MIRVFNGTELTLESEKEKEKEKYGDYTKKDEIVRSQEFFISTKDIDEIMYHHQEHLKKRSLYKDTNQNLKRRATFAGTTNYKELLRNENENRYMPFTIAERMDFDLLNSLDIMQVWSQIRDEVIRFKDKSMIHVDDLETIMNLSEEYTYHSPLETTLNNMLLFDSEGRIAFSDIMISLKEHGLYDTNDKVGGVLKSIPSEGQDGIGKTKDGSRFYKLKWRHN